MIKFGPSGNSKSFYDQGNKGTVNAPQWLQKKGLTCYEVPFGRGVNMSDATAISIGEEFAKFAIEISVHAPYFVNLATDEIEKEENSYQYIVDSIKKLKLLGGKRCVVHLAACGKEERAIAFERTVKNAKKLIAILKEQGIDDCLLCPETMGKHGQIGTVDEIIEICKLWDNFYPCVDFGHVNAFTLGALKQKSDFEAVIEKLYNGVGEQKTNNMHIHFSKIQYGKKGEIRHLTFEDQMYGPDYQPLMQIFAERKMTPFVICESSQTQAEDAFLLKKAWEHFKK